MNAITDDGDGHHRCLQACDWVDVNQLTLGEAWERCPRAPWMLVVAGHAAIAPEPLAAAMKACANTCAPRGSGLCDGHATLESYDCNQCCSVP